MFISGQQFTDRIISRIKKFIKHDPEESRRSLSRRVCDVMGWRSANGRLQDMSCRKALLKLDKLGVIKLPERKGTWSFQKKKTEASAFIPEHASVTCQFEELGKVILVPIESRNSQGSRIWNGLLKASHYLGNGPLCGAQIRYLVKSDRYGFLGGLSFSAAAWCLSARDEYIGWTEDARRHNLQRIVCNSRFLVVPDVKVHNLGSHVLSLALKRLGSDWKNRYGYTPVLVETFVDIDRFSGGVYKASNWIHIGSSKGEGRKAVKTDKNRSKKAIYLRTLTKNWQSILCRTPSGKIVINKKKHSVQPQDWSEEEFMNVDLGDLRLNKRLVKLGRQFYSRPGALIPEACRSASASNAAYRFMKNKRTSMSKILSPHYRATVNRIKNYDVVLAVQDTSSLNYTTLKSTEGLGPINTKKDSAVGLELHDTLAFTTEGIPLGLLDVQCWARPKNDSKEKDKKAPIEEKESFKWIKSYRSVSKIQKECKRTRLVSVGDREADIYELFAEKSKDKSSADILVRSERSRRRKVEDASSEEETNVYLWEKLEKQAVSATIDIHIPRQRNRKARTAVAEIRYAPVTLVPPKRKSHLSPIPIWAVYIVEKDSPAGIPPIEWMLLTTVATNTPEEAIERTQWYVKRWGIEIYHRTLKSGCRIEDIQLSNAARIESCLAIDMVVAWRIYHLTKLGQETPDLPCTEYCEEDEWKALVCFINETHEIPETPPTIREFHRMVASLGGFLNRKCDNNPGIQTTTRGLEVLDTIKKVWQIFAPIISKRTFGAIIPQTDYGGI